MRDTRTFRNTFQNPLTALLLVAAGMAGGGVVAWTAAQEREREPPMGQALFVGDDVVKPYDPVSSLVGKATDVARPKFPAKLVETIEEGVASRPPTSTPIGRPASSPPPC